MSLAGKTIVVGVTGGIAAYKACEVVRLLVAAGATVRVILTRAGAEFVTPLTLQALSGNPVARNTFDLTEESEIGHIRLADGADVLLIAPATANVIAKLAAGIADDLLTTVALACRAPIVVAPAMNVHMWENPTVRDNVARLAAAGKIIVEPDAGFLACGYEGAGRLPDAPALVEEVVTALAAKDMTGVRVLVTAGPTWEAIDPVRHVANRSSGKMGYAVARAARRRGAVVTLVSGPSALPAPRGIEIVRVTSAREMEDAAVTRAGESDVVIMAAAVGDYRPVEASGQKIKRAKGELTLRLAPNPDILARLGSRPGSRVLVGFAAETQDLIANARRKLDAKGVHLMVANDVTAEGAGFDVDTNVVTVLDRDGGVERLPQMSKDEVASAILDRVVKLRIAARTPRAEPRRLRRTR
jgi:phosphopantothenoylcysteine decarboxylase / phosphopantothenate---cysteine ligase